MLKPCTAGLRTTPVHAGLLQNVSDLAPWHTKVKHTPALYSWSSLASLACPSQRQRLKHWPSGFGADRGDQPARLPISHATAGHCFYLARCKLHVLIVRLDISLFSAARRYDSWPETSRVRSAFDHHDAANVQPSTSCALVTHTNRSPGCI